MLKKTITYTDFNGLERTEDFYFHLSQAEILEMELGTVGSLSAMMYKIIAANDTSELINIFNEMVLKAYGEKSGDGRRFVKSKEISDGFSQTEAYSQLFMSLATDAKLAADFVNGMIPSKMGSEQIKAPLAIAPVTPISPI